jgi:hypothetical protein
MDIQTLCLLRHARTKPAQGGLGFESERLAGRSRRTRRSRSPTFWGLRSSWCSQTLTTIHPRRRSFMIFRASRARFVAIFSRQNGDSLSAQAGNLQPCQKSPSTSMTRRLLRKTKSGRPGRSLACRSNLNLWEVNNVATIRSGPVSFPRIRAISRLRFSTDMTSRRTGWPAHGEGDRFLDTAFMLTIGSALPHAAVLVESLVTLCRLLR